MSMRTLLVAAGLAVASPLAAQSATPTGPSQDSLLVLGRHLTSWFLAGHADSILPYLSAESATQAGGVEGIRRASDQLAARAGDEMGVLVEKMNRRRGYAQFWHEATFSNVPEPIVIRWLFDTEGKIAGVGMGPKSSTPEPDEGS
jgi:hypothetical protein